MSELLDLYKTITGKINEINSKIHDYEAAINERSDNNYAVLTTRIQNLEQAIEKIDDYLLRIEGFKKLAEEHRVSKNLPAIEAPEGYRVNLSRHSEWARMIDLQSSDDPYADRIYLVASCDILFLKRKRREFLERIQSLKDNRNDDKSKDIDTLKKNITQLQEELRLYATGDEVTKFVKMVVSENSKYSLNPFPVKYSNPSAAAEVISMGAYEAPFRFDKELRVWFNSIMKDYYDIDGQTVMIPYEISNKTEYVLNIHCNPAKRAALDKSLQCFLMNSLLSSPLGSRKLYIVDGVRFNTSSISNLRALDETFMIETPPRNPEQLTQYLENIVSSFADIDEVIESFDSVAEYNASVGPGEAIPYSTIVVFGWPVSFTGRDRELLQRIMTGYERYGVSLIIVRYGTNDESAINEFNKSIPEYALQNAISFSISRKATSMSIGDGAPQKFKFYSLDESVKTEFANAMMRYEPKKSKKGNEYTELYSMTNLPTYVREYKPIELPFGLDSKDNPQSLSFENENFATYLVGASRSGKSTLIHTLIAGLIRNYHPDNVELWLADFKQLEFKRYISNLPPHVKYVLLDESTELVYDLVDKLTAEMLERQKLFGRLNVQRIDQIDTTKLTSPLPVIFVILDEFSIMSQSIATDDNYRLKLQNILAKGAALGIKFLFASQTFTTGVAGLTHTARAQIQQRIAMKSAKEEISETLELSSNLKTEQVKNWMDALPPHYALVKFRSGPDTLPQVKRYHVMYIKDYQVRDDMIAQINSTMNKSDKYDTDSINSYVDKHPVLVSGSVYEKFDNKYFDSFVENSRKNNSELAPDDVFVSFGVPRLMERFRASTLSSETLENILMIANNSEQSCAASIIMSAIVSYKRQLGKVQIWAYPKNKLFKAYKRAFEKAGAELIVGIDDICDAIYALKSSIMEKQNKKMLIIMIGMDRISTDFDFIDTSDSGPKKESFMDRRRKIASSAAVVSTPEQEKLRQVALKRGAIEDQIVAEGKKKGLTDKQIEKEKADALAKFDKENNLLEGEVVIAKPAQTETVEETEAKHQPGAYDASDDLLYVIKMGSKFGYHFMLDLNKITDIKSMSGVKTDLFRYRLAFQISADDSRDLFGTKIASGLPEHVCQFDDSLSRYSFRPYLHKDIGWDGWSVDENNQVINPFEDTTNEKT